MTSDWHRAVDVQRISTVNALHSLGQLIQSVEDSRGWTLREVARRVERTGRTMSHAYVARLKREPIRSVTYETLQALSVGLDLPERVVATAALETMGVHDIGTAETGAAVAIARDPDLSERDRRILLAVVREMHGEHTDEPSPAGERNSPTGPDTAAAGGDAVEGSPQPDGFTPSFGGHRVPSDRMPIDPSLTGSGRYSWSPDMPAEELYPLVGELAAQRDDQTAPQPLREQAGEILERLLSHLAEQHAPDTARAKDTDLGRSDAGPNAHLLQRGSENERSRDDRPWEQDEYGLAAKRGPNRGREARQQQDREAEGGGA